VCFTCGTLPTGTLIVCIPNLFPPKEKHNVGLLRFDDDQDHICYRFAQVRIFGGKSNVFKSLQQSVVYYVMRIKNEVLCAAASRLAAERSEADKPAKAHKTIFAPNNIQAV
jgi:hypothetical protein